MIHHTEATKFKILSRRSTNTCYYCCRTLTVDLMLPEFTVSNEGCDEYYTSVSFKIRLKTTLKSYILNFPREAGFFYFIWAAKIISNECNNIQPFIYIINLNVAFPQIYVNATIQLWNTLSMIWGIDKYALRCTFQLGVLDIMKILTHVPLNWASIYVHIWK